MKLMMEGNVITLQFLLCLILFTLHYIFSSLVCFPPFSAVPTFFAQTELEKSR